MEIHCVIEPALLASLREHCLTKPGAYEDYPWDQIAFKVAPSKKMFCSCFGMIPAVMMKSTPNEQAALVLHPSISFAPYLGKHGWVQVMLRDEDELALARELIDASYALIAPKPRR